MYYHFSPQRITCFIPSLPIIKYDESVEYYVEEEHYVATICQGKLQKKVRF